MTTMQFLDYLHQHPATAGLAEGIAEVFVLRGRITAAALATTNARRVAS